MGDGREDPRAAGQARPEGGLERLDLVLQMAQGLRDPPPFPGRPGGLELGEGRVAIEPPDARRRRRLREGIEPRQPGERTRVARRIDQASHERRAQAPQRLGLSIGGQHRHAAGLGQRKQTDRGRVGALGVEQPAAGAHLLDRRRQRGRVRGQLLRSCARRRARMPPVRRPERISRKSCESGMERGGIGVALPARLYCTRFSLTKAASFRTDAKIC